MLRNNYGQPSTFSLHHMMPSHTLWFVPPPPAQETLNKIVRALSQKYQAPVFEPHLTLLDDIPITETAAVKKTRQLAGKITPFTVELAEVSASTTYDHCVFVRVKATAALLQANMGAKKIFAAENTPFTPHISLLYGNYPVDLRIKIAAAIKLPPQFSFPINMITIVPNTDEPAGWSHLAEIHFGG